MPNQHPGKNEHLARIPPSPKSNSFFRNFLTAIHNLQGIEGFDDGVTIEDIEFYMCRHYPMDGDVTSQLTWASNLAVNYGCLVERHCRYFLIHAMAKIYLTTEEKDKEREKSYAKRLFRTPWKRCCVVRKPSKQVETTCSQTCPTPKKRCGSAPQGCGKKSRCESNTKISCTSRSQHRFCEAEKCKNECSCEDTGCAKKKKKKGGCRSRARPRKKTKCVKDCECEVENDIDDMLY